MNMYVERIAQYRKSKGLTQKQMADKLGIAQVNYGKIENGKTELTLSKLAKISNILDVNIITLLWPDYKDAEFNQKLVDENSRLKKNNDLLIKANEDKDRFLGLILQFYPETKSIMEANKSINDLRGLGLIKSE